MKNKKGNIVIITIIIIVVAITAGVVGWKFAKKSQAPETQVATTQPVATVPQMESMVTETQSMAEPVDPSEKEIAKKFDYAIRNLKMDPITPKVNDPVLISFDIYNNGQVDLGGNDYEIELSGANMIPDNSKSTCSESKIISPGSSCSVKKKVSYSIPGEYTIAIIADPQKAIEEFDEGNNYASLNFKVKPDIRVEYPNGGETLKVGKTYKIKWSVKSDNISKIQLFVFNSSANGIFEIANDLDANRGYFEWTLPSLDDLPGIGGKDYQIRITDPLNNEVIDESNSKFSIVAD